MNPKNLKKIILTAILLSYILVISGSFIQPVYAETDPNTYTMLAPLPCVGGDCTTESTETTLAQYIPGAFKLAIGLSAAAAVLMIIWGGVQYMTSDAIQGKSAGKERIRTALIGLVLVIASWLILNTINPNLLKIDLNIKPATTTALKGVTVNGTLINLNTQDQLLNQSEASTLLGSGFTLKSSGNCTDRTNSSCTSLDGIHSDTVSGLVALKDACGTACATLVITGGTETGHACSDPATCLSHESGFKADISYSRGNGAALRSYISQQVQTQDHVSMTANGFYNITVGGFTYQVHPEDDHMDITVVPK